MPVHRALAESRDHGRLWFTWIIAVATAILLCLPLAFLLLTSLRGPPDFLPIEPGARWTFDNFAYFYLDRKLYTEILPNTFVFATGSLAMSCAIALFMAWHFERPRSRRTVWARILILAPMAIPTPALAVAWIQLLGPNSGWVNQILRSLLASDTATGPFDIFSMSGIIWCQGLAGIPLAYLLLSPAVRAVRSDMEEAGYVAGARPCTVFRRISVPAVLPSVAGPLLILFLIGLEQVDFPYILGPTAGIHVLGTRILWEGTSPSGIPNFGATAAAAMLILALAVAGLVLHDRLLKNRPEGSSTSWGKGVPRWSPGWVGVAMWMVLGAYFFVSFAIPTATLVVQSIGSLGWDFDTAASCCAQGFAIIASDGRFWRALANTLLVSAAAAAIGTFIGVGIALCAASGSDRVSAALNKLSVSSIAIPSLLVAFGVAVTFMSIPIGVYGTVGLLIIAYSYRLALSTRMARGAVTQLGNSVCEAASVSGARWARTQISIILPLIVPSIVASAAILFVVAVKEFIIPMMLYSPNNVVLSVLLLQLQQSGNSAGAAATGIVMIAVTLLGVIALTMADEGLTRAGGRG